MDSATIDPPLPKNRKGLSEKIIPILDSAIIDPLPKNRKGSEETIPIQDSASIDPLPKNRKGSEQTINHKDSPSIAVLPKKKRGTPQQTSFATLEDESNNVYQASGSRDPLYDDHAGPSYSKPSHSSTSASKENRLSSSGGGSSVPFRNLKLDMQASDSEFMNRSSSETKFGEYDDLTNENHVEGHESEIEISEASSCEEKESSAAGSSNSKIDRLWKSDPWAALHKIVGTFFSIEFILKSLQTKSTK